MDRVLELLDKLVSFDTVSEKSNLSLIDFCKAELAEQGIAAEIIASPAGDKANLFATIGPDGPGGVILSGHSDVVPVESQRWHTPPFSMKLAHGRAFGRGTADMKGFIACALAAVPMFKRAPLARPVHLAITFDEEVGCKGAPSLIDWLAYKGLAPQAVFVGEPTDMAVVNAHKGLLAVRTEFTGAEAHSSLPHLGISAVTLAARAIGLLDGVANDAARGSDARFTPDSTTISINRIQGGTATNILAGRCWFDWDIRAIPGEDPDQLLRTIVANFYDLVISPVHARYPELQVSSKVHARVPGLLPEPDGPAEALALRLTGGQSSHVVSYVTEAGLYQKAGHSVVVVGPGSIEQAHRADEYVSLEQLQQCQDFLVRLGDALSVP